MALTIWATKGQKLTAEEADANIIHLRDKPDGQVYPKTKGIGLKVDHASPDWGWHDLLSTIRLDGGVGDPTYVTYQGNIHQAQFDVDNHVDIEFHMPHDYAMGTDLYIHAHWSHNNANVTGGSITGTFEATYAKGHNQMSFVTPIVVTVVQDASLIRYQHMIAEGQLSAPGGAGGLLKTEDIEVDGLILAQIKLTGNTMDGGAKPFLHAVDIHYQSTGLPTKQKAPDFWT